MRGLVWEGGYLRGRDMAREAETQDVRKLSSLYQVCFPEVQKQSPHGLDSDWVIQPQGIGVRPWIKPQLKPPLLSILKLYRLINYHFCIRQYCFITRKRESYHVA